MFSLILRWWFELCMSQYSVCPAGAANRVPDCYTFFFFFFAGRWYFILWGCSREPVCRSAYRISWISDHHCLLQASHKLDIKDPFERLLYLFALTRNFLIANLQRVERWRLLIHQQTSFEACFFWVPPAVSHQFSICSLDWSETAAAFTRLTALCVCVSVQSVWCLRAVAMACSSGQNNAETLEGFHEVNLASPTTPDLQVRLELASRSR